MAELRKLDFERFAPEIRLKIYRMLLITRGRLDPVYGEYSTLHPAILRANNKIHEEAAAVLYGENICSFSCAGRKPEPLWHHPGSKKTYLPRQYSRLITRLHLHIDFKGDDNDPSDRAVMSAFHHTEANVEDACKKLTLNDLKSLTVSFINSYTGGPAMGVFLPGRFPGRPYVGENCLMPLKKVRAVQVRYHKSPLLVGPCTHEHCAVQIRHQPHVTNLGG